MLNINQWQKIYNTKNIELLKNATWVDWFCKETSLTNKTIKLGKIVKQLKSGKINRDSMYVWFKNNCPLYGPLYDDIRIADIESGETLFIISINDPWNNNNTYKLYSKQDGFNIPIITSNYIINIINYLNRED